MIQSIDETSYPGYTTRMGPPRTIATLSNGETVRTLGHGFTGVRMMAIVGVVKDQSVFVRAYRWRRYAETVDGRSRLTGFGDARVL